MSSKNVLLSLGLAGLIFGSSLTGCTTNTVEDRPGPMTSDSGASSSKSDSSKTGSDSTKPAGDSTKTSGGAAGGTGGTGGSTSGGAATRTPSMPPAPAGASSASLALPTGDPATSVVLLEKMLPSEIQAGAPFTYTVRVTNLTRTTLQGVVLTDNISSKMNVSGATPPADSKDGSTMRWTLGTFASGESKTVAVNATVADSGSFENCGTVSWNQGLCVASNVVSPRLQVTKTMPSDVLACDPINMKIVVTNNGTGSARNVKVTDALPSGLTDTSGKSTLEWDVGTLAAGQSREVTASLKAAKSGSYTNTATAKADGGLTGESNSTTTVVRKPVLQISMSCPDHLFIGLKGDKVITVKNTGDGPAKDCVVEDTLPAGITFVAADNGGTAANGKVQWRLGTLEAGASKTMKLTFTSTTQGTMTNTAKAMAYCADAVSADCQSRFEGIPAILLEVVDENDPIRVGDTEVYTITVTNQGSATDTNIRLTCEVEAAQQLVSGSGATTGTASGATMTFAPLAKLDAKARATWKVTVKAMKAGDIRFKVALKSDQLTRTVDETEATNQYE